MIERREFIALFVGATAAWPLAAHAQQIATPVIGSSIAVRLTPMGTVCVRTAEAERNRRYPGTPLTSNIAGPTGKTIDRHHGSRSGWQRGERDRRPAGSRDTGGRKAATSTIPSCSSYRPIPSRQESSPPASARRQSTGITGLNVEIAPKKLELMHELLPGATMVALLSTRRIRLPQESRPCRPLFEPWGCSFMSCM